MQRRKDERNTEVHHGYADRELQQHCKYQQPARKSQRPAVRSRDDAEPDGDQREARDYRTEPMRDVNGDAGRIREQWSAELAELNRAHVNTVPARFTYRSLRARIADQ